jgi:O-antigen/teichoic acid export membrane protein
MSEADLSGRSRLAKNALASYAGHFVFIVFGFVTPRIVDVQVGQVALGVWDFCWTLVNYLNMSMIGIGASVNRYVARYRSKGDFLALSRTISTVVAIQLGIAAFTFVGTMLLSFAIPMWFGDRLGSETETAVWVIRFLGCALAIQMAFDAWRGVLSGCHRWDYYNALNAGGYTVASVLMIAALYMGYGLPGMALMYFVITFATEFARYKVARIVCPEIELRRTHINKGDGVKVVKFGLKTIMLGMPPLIAIQTINIFVVANLGPAALAVLARPMALVNHVGVLVGKYSNILTPTAGSLQSQDKIDEVREFAMQTSRAGWLLTIPPLAFLFVLGDMVIELWMGPKYADWTVCAILVVGQMLAISQGPLLNILVGLNAHGAVAKMSAIVTGLTLITGLIVMSFGEWTLVAAAALVSISIGVGLGLTVLIYGFHYLKIGVAEYFREVLLEGVILMVATLAALFAVRYYLDYSSGIMVLIGLAVTGAIFLLLHMKDTRKVILALSS